MNHMNDFLDTEQLDNFFSKFLNSNTFILFSKIQSLKNRDLYRILINLLAENKITLYEVASLDLIDDESIRVLIDNYNQIYGFSSINETTSDNEFNAYNYLFGNNDTPIYDLMRKYTLKKNNEFANDISDEFKSVNIPYIRLGNGNVYHSEFDFKTAFDKNVLSKLVSSVDDEVNNDIIKSIEFKGSNEENAFFNALYSHLAEPFIENYNNENLYKFIVEISNTSSTFKIYYNILHQNFNINKFSDNLDYILKFSILKMRNENKGLDENDAASISAYLTDLSKIDKITSLNEFISDSLFKSELLNTYALHENKEKISFFNENLDILIKHIEILNNKFFNLLDLVIKNLLVTVK